MHIYIYIYIYIDIYAYIILFCPFFQSNKIKWDFFHAVILSVLPQRG